MAVTALLFRTRRQDGRAVPGTASCPAVADAERRRLTRALIRPVVTDLEAEAARSAILPVGCRTPRLLQDERVPSDRGSRAHCRRRATWSIRIWGSHGLPSVGCRRGGSVRAILYPPGAGTATSRLAICALFVVTACRAGALVGIHWSARPAGTAQRLRIRCVLLLVAASLQRSRCSVTDLPLAAAASVMLTRSVRFDCQSVASTPQACDARARNPPPSWPAAAQRVRA